MRSEADFLMNEENEREEYSGEMSAGAHREENAAEERKQEEFGAKLEAEISKIFSEDVSSPDKKEHREKMPIPSKRTLPKQAEKRQTSVQKKKEEPKREEIPREEQKNPKEKSHGTARYAIFLTLLLLCAIVLCAFAVSLGRKYVSEEVLPVGEEDPPIETTGKEKIVFVREYDDESGLLSLPELYEKYAGAVVSIRTQGKNAGGVGSGFFLREDGYIATVAHVVEGMDTITVVTREGKSFRASLVASNAMTDLALLKIEGNGFPSVTFGASGELLTGERVVAIGTPASLDYAGTLSSGEISYCLRTVKIYDDSGQILQKKMKLLQTNVPVNRGNSGCPLFDEYGRVVGIITMKLGADFEGLGFAIPSDGASEILGKMMRGETLNEETLSTVSMSAPRLGVLGETGQSDGIAGVKILRFSAETCDAAIKLKEGDLIIGLDGEAVASMEKMISLVQAKNPGDEMLVTVLRAGQRLTFAVILEKS